MVISCMVIFSIATKNLCYMHNDKICQDFWDISDKQPTNKSNSYICIYFNANPILHLHVIQSRFSKPSAFLNPLPKVWQRKFCQQRFVMEFLIYQLIRLPEISARYFLFGNRCSMQFCTVFQIKSNVHLLYSFIHVFIHNSIKCFWQRP